MTRPCDGSGLVGLRSCDDRDLEVLRQLDQAKDEVAPEERHSRHGRTMHEDLGDTVAAREVDEGIGGIFPRKDVRLDVQVARESQMLLHSLTNCRVEPLKISRRAYEDREAVGLQVVGNAAAAADHGCRRSRR